MITAFISIRFLDILDIVLVAYLLYRLYLAIKGTVAFNIVMGIVIVYISWVLIDGLNMELIGSIMGQVMAVGVIAIIVVFQQEIRKLFLTLGSRYKITRGLSFDSIFSKDQPDISNEQVKEIVMACEMMSRSKTGALIVLTHKVELNEYIETGERIDAKVSVALLESLFFKNSPLHDGGVIIHRDTIKAARCILPVTNKKIKGELGLRHRAALGMSESTDAQVIIVSEETGNISHAYDGKLNVDLNAIQLTQIIEETYKK